MSGSSSTSFSCRALVRKGVGSLFNAEKTPDPFYSGNRDDGLFPAVRTDPARPGFAWQRMWVTDSEPAAGE
jgi:hypothetical protein